MEQVLYGAFEFLVSVAHAQSQSQIYLGPTLEAVSVTSTQAPPGLIIRNIYNFALMLGGILAFGMIVYGAVKYTISGGNPSGQSDARDVITQALLGLLLLMGAFIVLNLINPELTGLNLPTLGKIRAVREGQLPDATATGLSQDSALFQLGKGGIGLDGSVYYLAGIQQSTIDEVLRLKQACGCDVVITSATGGVHKSGIYSHARGYKVDLRLNNELNRYVENPDNFENIGPRSDDGAPQYRLKGGPATQEVIYAKESDHWDVVVRPRAGATGQW